MNLPSVGPPSIQFTQPPNAPMLGLPEALTTVTVFSDFECPYCSKMAQELNDLITGAPKLVKVVFRHFPLSFHPNATNAAVFAGCAHQQNKFRVFHDSLFESGQDLSRKGLWLLAEKHGLDRTQMETCVNGQEILRRGGTRHERRQTHWRERHANLIHRPGRIPGRTNGRGIEASFKRTREIGPLRKKNCWN